MNGDARDEKIFKICVGGSKKWVEYVDEVFLGGSIEWVVSQFYIDTNYPPQISKSWWAVKSCSRSRDRWLTTIVGVVRV